MELIKYTVPHIKSTLSDFQEYKTLLLPAVTMLYNRPPDLLLLTDALYPLTYISPTPYPQS
jgi:hypothetical protein